MTYSRSIFLMTNGLTILLSTLLLVGAATSLLGHGGKMTIALGVLAATGLYRIRQIRSINQVFRSNQARYRLPPPAIVNVRRSMSRLASGWVVEHFAFLLLVFTLDTLGTVHPSTLIVFIIAYSVLSTYIYMLFNNYVERNL